MNILFSLVIMLVTLLASSAGQHQHFYKRMGLLSKNVSSKITENLLGKSKIECGALCSVKTMGQCNSFVYSKKQQSCQLAKLDLNPGIAPDPNPDSETYISQGKWNLTHGIQNLFYLNIPL